MELKDQVVSLELAKKLKELGVKQESYLLWAEYNDQDDNHIAELLTSPGSYSATFTSAFTVAELGEMLPESTISYLFVTQWRIRLVEWENTDRFIMANTEANARGEMLVYLIKNKLIIL